jgi:hypothetical protein
MANKRPLTSNLGLSLTSKEKVEVVKSKGLGGSEEERKQRERE